MPAQDGGTEIFVRKILSILCIILILTASVSVCAKDGRNIIKGEGLITFSGSLGTECAGGRVSLIVLKPGCTLDEFYSSENPLDLLVAYKQGTADGDGKFSFDIFIDENSARFPVFVSVQGGEYTSGDIYYVKKSENESAVNAISSAGSAGDIQTVIENKKYALNLNYELLDLSNIGKASAILFDSVSSLDSDNLTSQINRALALSAFYDGKISMFAQFYNDFNINDDISSYLTQEFMNETAKAKLEQRLHSGIEAYEAEHLAVESGKYMSCNDFEELLIKESAKIIVEYADGIGFIKKFLTDNAQVLSVNALKVTDDVCKKMIGRAYDDLGAAVDSTYESLNQTSDGSSSSSSSSSSSGKNSVNIPSIKTVTEVNNTQPIADNTPSREGNAEEVISDFTDLTDYEWAKDAIYYLRDLKVVRGKENGIFEPQSSVLREEFVKMIMQGVGFAELDGTIGFEDVKEDDWFYNDVKNAYIAKIISGESDKIFGSGRSITRAEMAVIIVNAANKAGAELNASDTDMPFADGESIAGWAYSSVKILSDAKIIKGDENGNFNPDNSATRAEAAQLIYNLLKYINR